MSAQSISKVSTHPFVLFWLGVLTGAVVVALIFFQKQMANDEYKSSVLMMPYSYTYTYTKPLTVSRWMNILTAPMTTTIKNIGDPAGG